MATKKYDIQITAQISIGGVYEANTMQEAIETARMELRQQGGITDISVERSVFLDDPETEPVPFADLP